MGVWCVSGHGVTVMGQQIMMKRIENRSKKQQSNQVNIANLRKNKACMYDGYCTKVVHEKAHKSGITGAGTDQDSQDAPKWL